jgi:hypothetical protein
MLNGNDAYLMLGGLAFAVSILFVILAILKSKKRSILTNEVTRKKQILNEKSVEDVVAELSQSYEEIKEKIEAGGDKHIQLLDLISSTNEQSKLIDSGLLPPVFKFDDSESLKEKIKECQLKQFDVIVTGKAVSAHSNWSWFGSSSDGSKMVEDYKRLLLKAFNSEFDSIRKKMRHNTLDGTLNKLHKLDEQLTKLGETTNVEISQVYFKLKASELNTWNIELKHKEELKQERKAQQTLLRQQSKQGSGIDSDELEDDIYYRKADLLKAQKRAKELHGASATDTQLKIERMQKEIKRLEDKFERSVSQAQLTRAGYIYVISNIGSFGEGVVKIGMTRRLEPMDRVKELGDASVPFRFDVHTLVFVEDAPKVEKMLHRKFNNHRVNKENNRKEFFKVLPNKVSEAMLEMGIKSDWFFDVEAKEFRESLLIREALSERLSQTSNSSVEFPEAI